MLNKLFLLLIVFLFGLGVAAYAQRIVNGIVINDKGEGLVGASVRVTGTSIATITDEDGRFMLEVPTGKNELVVTYLGYQKQSVQILGSEVRVVMVSANTGLNEVVVVGYGTQKKESVTGSVAQIGSEEIRRAPIGNITGMITGKLPGLVSRQSSGMPGSDDASMNIRGASSFGSSNAPVVIVDGIRRPFNNLDPEEIESITILKDASAAAVYGLKAASGVILVKTKTGKIGAPTVHFSSSLALTQNTMFPEFLNGPEYAYWYNKARKLNGNKPPLFTNDQIRKILEGDPEGKWGNTNWVDEVFKTGFTMHNSISVSGGTDRMKYYFFGGYYQQEGNVENINYDRFNFRSNIEANIADNLKATIGIGGNKGKRESPFFSTGKNAWANIFSQAMRMHPYMPKTYDGYPTATHVNGPKVSPIAAVEQSGFHKSYRESFQGNIKLDLELPWLTKGLSISGLASYDYRNQYGKALQTPFKVALGTVTPSGISYSIVESALGKNELLAENTSRRGFVTLQGSIDYHNQFGKHQVSGLLLYEQFKTVSNEFSISTEGLDFVELPELSFAKELKPGGDAFSGGSNLVPSAGFVGRFNYAYDNKYLLEISGRYDGSYKFDRSNRWALFPAVSVGWRISNEDFFGGNLAFVDDLKLRASVGKLGNDAGVSAYTYLSTMQQVSSDPVVVIGDEAKNAYRTNKLSNPNLSWETAVIYNYGFDAVFFSNHLTVNFDFFYKITSNILEKQGGVYPPSVGGYFPSIVNTGLTDNRGFEVALGYSGNVNKLNYGVKFNISYYKNRYLDVQDSKNIQDHLKRNGRPLGQKHGLVALGIFQTDKEARDWPSVFGGQKAGDIKYEDVNGDGRITYADDRQWIASSSVPQLMSSLALYADYKGFDLSIYFQGAALAEYALSGYYPGLGYDNTEFTTAFFQLGNAPKYLVENMWTPENRDAKYPRLSDIKVQNNKWASTMWIVDGSYLRLKSVQIGYSLPKNLIKKIGGMALRLYVAGGNVFTWTEFPYMDPEAPDVSNGFYPQQKTYEVGLEVKF